MFFKQGGEGEHPPDQQRPSEGATWAALPYRDHRRCGFWRPLWYGEGGLAFVVVSYCVGVECVSGVAACGFTLVVLIGGAALGCVCGMASMASLSVAIICAAALGCVCGTAWESSLLSRTSSGTWACQAYFNSVVMPNKQRSAATTTGASEARSTAGGTYRPDQLHPRNDHRHQRYKVFDVGYLI